MPSRDGSSSRGGRRFEAVRGHYNSSAYGLFRGLPASWPTGVALQPHITEGDEHHEIAQTLAATLPNAELFVDPRRGALLHRRAAHFLQALVGDEFRAAARSHTLETTGRCGVHRRVREERAASAIKGGESSKS